MAESVVIMIGLGIVLIAIMVGMVIMDGDVQDTLHNEDIQEHYNIMIVLTMEDVREDAHQPTLLHLLITEKEITLQVI